MKLLPIKETANVPVCEYVRPKLAQWERYGLLNKDFT